MFVVDKVVDEDKKESKADQELTVVILPDASEQSLSPSASDAFAVVEDLCLLANSEKSNNMGMGEGRPLSLKQHAELATTAPCHLIRKLPPYHDCVTLFWVIPADNGSDENSRG